MTNHERVKSVFTDVKAPDGFAQKVIDGADAGKKFKPRPLHKVIFIAAIICILTTTVLAAAGYLGGFERLTGIIGDERVEGLYPVERSNEIGSLLTDEGIRIEVVAIGIDSNVVEFYFTLEDMVSNRLEGDVWIYATVFPILDGDLAVGWSQGERGLSPEVIHRGDDGIVTLRGTEVFEQPVTGLEFRFNLYNIAFNVRSGEHDMGIDLSSVGHYEPFAFVNEMPVLPLDMHNIETYADGGDWFNRISSIGIIDGKLHIQVRYDPSRLTSWNPPDGLAFRLYDPGGDWVMWYEEPHWTTYVPIFMTDEHGNILYYVVNDMNDSYYIDDNGYIHDPGTHVYSYREYIYNVNIDRLSEYKITAEYIRGEYIDTGFWNTTFELNITGD